MKVIFIGLFFAAVVTVGLYQFSNGVLFSMLLIGAILSVVVLLKIYERRKGN